MIVTVLTLHSVSPTARLVTGLAWVGATLAAGAQVGTMMFSTGAMFAGGDGPPAT